MPQRINELATLASALIGDGKSPDLFFVTDRGAVVAIERDGESAYRRWRELAARSPRVESAIENRTYGVLASVSPDSDDSGARLVTVDEYHAFRARKHKAAN